MYFILSSKDMILRRYPQASPDVKRVFSTKRLRLPASPLHSHVPTPLPQIFGFYMALFLYCLISCNCPKCSSREKSHVSLCFSVDLTTYGSFLFSPGHQKNTCFGEGKSVQVFVHLFTYHQQALITGCYATSLGLQPRCLLGIYSLGSGQKRRETDLCRKSYYTTWQLLYQDIQRFMEYDLPGEDFRQETTLKVKKMPLKGWICQDWVSNVHEPLLCFLKILEH